MCLFFFLFEQKSGLPASVGLTKRNTVNIVVDYLALRLWGDVGEKYKFEGHQPVVAVRSQEWQGLPGAASKVLKVTGPSLRY